MKRIAYLTGAVLVALLTLTPTALAQEDTVAGDDNPFLPEPTATAVDMETLRQIAGRPEPQPPASEPLPATGGLEVSTLLLPAAALLMSSGVLAYVVVRRK